MATLTWDNGGGDQKISTANNWDLNQVPVAGDTLVFPDIAIGAVDFDMSLAFADINSGSFGSGSITQSVPVNTTVFNFDGVAGMTWVMNGFDLNVGGSFIENNGAIVYGVAGDLILSGINQSVSKTGGNTIYNLKISQSGGTINIPNTFNVLNLLSAEALTAAYTIKFQGSATTTINKLVTLAGAFNVAIEASGVAPATLAITDYTTVNENSDWKDITVSGGTLNCNVATCSLVSGTTNISLVAVSAFTWDNGAAGVLFSEALNWSGDGVPDLNSDLIFDATSVVDATCDISDAKSVDMQATYTGIVTQTVAFSLSGNFDLAGILNNDTEWITNGNDLYVDGNFTSLLGEGVSHQAGGTLYIGGDANVDNGSGNHYTSPVKFHHSKATPTIAKSHDVIWSRPNSMTEDLVLGVSQSLQLVGGLNCDLITFDGDNLITDDGNAGGRIVDVTVRMVGVENSTWLATAPGKLQIQFSGHIDPAAHDFGNVDLEYQTDLTALVGPVVTTGDIALKLPFGTGTNSYTLVGSLACKDFRIGNSGSTVRASAFTQNADSSLNVSGDLSVYEDDGIQTTVWKRVAGALNSVITGNLLVETLAELDFTGDTSTISIGGDITLSATAVINWGDVIVELNGVNQTVDWGGNPPKNIKYTGSGTLTHIGLVAITGKHIFKPSAPLAVKFPNGGILGALELDASGVSSFGTLDLDSVDGVSTYTMPVTQAGVAMKYVSVGRMVLTGVAQPIDSNTSTDLGGNRLVPPEVDGLEFTSVAASRDIIRPVARSVTRSIVRPV